MKPIFFYIFLIISFDETLFCLKKEDSIKLNLLYQEAIEHKSFSYSSAFDEEDSISITDTLYKKNKNVIIIRDSTINWREPYNIPRKFVHFKKFKIKKLEEEFYKINLKSELSFKFNSFSGYNCIWMDTASYWKKIRDCCSDTTIKKELEKNNDITTWLYRRSDYCRQKIFHNVFEFCILSKPLIKNNMAIIRISDFKGPLDTHNIIYLMIFKDGKWKIIDFIEINYLGDF